MDFEGTIPEGAYGAGKVRLQDRMKTEVLRAAPGHIVFNLYRGKGPEEYVLHRIDGEKWKLTNRTLRREQLPDVPTSKPDYASVPITKVDTGNARQLMSAKIDDAHNLFLFPKGRPIRVISWRPTERETGVIEHTHKVKGLLEKRTPEELAGTVVRGGLYAMDPRTGKAVSASTLAGLLNANVWTSREQQQVLGTLRPVIYDVVAHGGKDLSTAPYEEKLQVLEKVRQRLPVFELPRMARTKEEKEQLLQDIMHGRLPETEEGVVLWNLHEGSPPVKAKVFTEHDVHVRDFFPGEGKHEGKGVGGFFFSHVPDGPVVGRVGTGLSDALRRDMHRRPEAYQGLVARVEAQERFPSGALRAPAFKGWHLDKNEQQRLDEVLHSGHEKKADLISTLQPHQQRVVQRIQQPDQPGLVVMHGLGSGKTLSEIAAADALKMPTTAVVPASLRSNLTKEVQKHVAPGTGPQMDIRSMQAIARSHEPIHTGLLAIDEAHRLRESGGAAAQALLHSQAQKRLLMTASPFYNRPSDVAMPINLAAGRPVLPTDPRQFEERYLVKDQVGPGLLGRIMGLEPGTVSRLNPAHKAELQQIFQKWVDYYQPAPGSGDFPSVDETTVRIPMTNLQRQVYDLVMDKAPLWLRMKVKMGLPPTMAEAKQLNAFLNAARQVANTTRSFAPAIAPQEPKIMRAVQDLKEELAKNQQAKAVIYSNYLASGLHPYAAQLQAANIPHAVYTGELTPAEKDKIIQDYNEDRIKALLVSSAGGEGLDLKGTRLMQVLEPHWNIEKLKQVVGRGARFGSHAALPEDQRNLRVLHYLTTYPEENGILQRLGITKQDQAVDEYLAMLASQKQQLNEQFRALMAG
jgi:superfamily II DNA or RNA helicase